MECTHLISHAYVLKNDIAELPPLAEFVERVGAQAGLSPSIVYVLNLALDEWVTNLVSYAYPPGELREIHVAVQIHDDWVVLEIRDDGTPFDPVTQAPPAPTSGDIEERPIGGLGLYLIKRMFDHIHYKSECGWNVLRLEKNRA